MTISVGTRKDTVSLIVILTKVPASHSWDDANFVGAEVKYFVHQNAILRPVHNVLFQDGKKSKSGGWLMSMRSSQSDVSSALERLRLGVSDELEESRSRKVWVM